MQKKIAFIFALSLSACNLLNSVSNNPTGALSGEASYYSDNFQGKKTASGEPYDKNKLTAAHKTLQFGTMVEVTHLKSGKKVTVKINDRLPANSARVIDLSKAAAQKLGIIQTGVANVSLRIIE